MNNTKSKTVISAIAALCMGMNGLAFAQDDHHNGPGRGGPDRGGPEHAQGHDDHGRGDHGRPPGPRPRMDRGPGAGPDHNFYKGGRLPSNYRGREYVVDDWRGHHLNQPPRGYQWVQVGGDYVMVAVATGIIASLLLNR